MKNLICSILLLSSLCFVTSCTKSDDNASSDNTHIVVDLKSDISFKSTAGGAVATSRVIDESVYSDITNYTVKLTKADNGEVVNTALYKDWSLVYEVEPGQQYKLEAYYGEISSPASYDNLYVYGSETFNVQAGSTKKIGFQCKPQAIKVNLAYSEDFANYFSDCVVSIKTKHMAEAWTMGIAEVGKDLYLQSDAQEIVELSFDIKDKNGDSVSPEGFTNTKQVTVSSQTLLKINISPTVTEVEGGQFGINITVNTDIEDENVNIVIPSDLLNN